MRNVHDRLACVSLYLNGWRDVVVLSHGPRWLTGFTAATLEHVRMPSDCGPRPLSYSRTRLARRLRANAKIYPVTKTVRTAIAELGRR
jgi:hypothetical protein